MEIKEMSIEELEERKNAIVAELDNEGADLDALEEEMRSIKAELEERKATESKKAEIRASVAQGEGVVTKEIEKEVSTHMLITSRQRTRASAAHS